MRIASLMQSPLWMTLGWTMLHFLWVGALLALAAAATRATLRRASPQRRYTVALVWLAALTLTPGVVFLTVEDHYPAPAQRPNRPFRDTAVVQWSDTSASTPALRDSAMPAAQTGAERTTKLPPRQPTADRTRPTVAPTTIARMIPYLPWIWIVGTPLVATLVAAGLLGAERLRRQTHLLHGSEPAALCRRLCASLQVGRRVSLGLCERVTSPVVLGIIRPLILLPPCVISGCSPEQLEMILLHELAHVRRWDNLVNLLQRLVESLLFFHPGVWWVSHWIRVEREHCCDAVVVAHTGKPHGYASMLAALAAPVRVDGALAFSESNLVGRIRRILDLQHGGVAMPRAVLGSMALLSLVPTTVFLVYASIAAAPGPKTEGRTRSVAKRIFRQASQADRPNAVVATLLTTLGNNRLKHWDAVRALAFSDDGQALVSAGCTINVWNTATGAQRRSVAPCGKVVAFTPDGRFAAVGQKDNTVRVSELNSGKVLTTLPGMERPCASSHSMVPGGCSPRAIATG